MSHHTPLITLIVAGLGLAFVFGALAQRLRFSPLVGYLLAGIVIGPFSPGFVADQGMANELAEIGVILLMFGVGLHFSLEDLLSVRAIAIPGAIVQIAVATALGAGLAHLWGWPFGAGLVFGLALSVASTVVLLRALEDRNTLDSINGRIAVGWLIVEDLATVLALVLLPAFAGVLGGDPRGLAGHAGAGGLGLTLALTLGKVGLFLVLVLVVGQRGHDRPPAPGHTVAEQRQDRRRDPGDRGVHVGGGGRIAPWHAGLTMGGERSRRMGRAAPRAQDAARLSGRVGLGETLERPDRLQQQAGGSVGQRAGVDLLATARRGVQLEGIAADVLA